MTTWRKRLAAAEAEGRWNNPDPDCPVCGGNGWEYIIERNHDGFDKELDDDSVHPEFTDEDWASIKADRDYDARND